MIHHFSDQFSTRILHFKFWKLCMHEKQQVCSSTQCRQSLRGGATTLGLVIASVQYHNFSRPDAAAGNWNIFDRQTVFSPVSQ